MFNRSTSTTQRYRTAIAGLLFSVGSAFGQFVPDQPQPKPAQPTPSQPGTPAPAPQDTPQTPGGQPGQTEFPGPRGTKITFPTNLYDENALAAEQILKAREQARAENKRVLVMWGENRCGFCVFLNDLLKTDPQVAPLVKGEYVWIKIDIGKFDKNIELAGVYNTPLMQQGFGAPALTVIDPSSDQAVDVRGGNSMVATPMTAMQPFDSKKLYEFLSAARPPAQVGITVLNNALAEAKKSGNKVLAYFVVPGSDDCEALEAWIKQAEKSTDLLKGVQTVKIDTQRMIGGSSLLKKAAGTDAAAAPFLCILDVEGASVGPEAMLTALPSKDGEIKQFADMLKAHAPKLSDAQREAIVKSIKKPEGKP